MIADYFADLKQQLILCSVVLSFKVIKEFYGSNDGFIRIKYRIESGTELEFAEYIRIVRGNQIRRETYSYHWQTRDGILIKRWDNAPHHQELSTFPDHLHDGEQVKESKPASLAIVLKAMTVSCE